MVTRLSGAISLPPEATTRRYRLPLTGAPSCLEDYAPEASRQGLRAFLFGLGSVTFGHERGRKVHAGKIRSGQVRLA